MGSPPEVNMYVHHGVNAIRALNACALRFECRVRSFPNAVGPMMPALSGRKVVMHQEVGIAEKGTVTPLLHVVQNVYGSSRGKSRCG